MIDGGISIWYFWVQGYKGVINKNGVIHTSENMHESVGKKLMMNLMDTAMNIRDG